MRCLEIVASRCVEFCDDLLYLKSRSISRVCFFNFGVSKYLLRGVLMFVVLIKILKDVVGV